MKYAILVGDGMADFPVRELGDRTPLEYAQTPSMDSLAGRGILRRIQTVPAGMAPGSDVANMSLLGYDPARYYQGRAPIEAASMGVALRETDVAFRCNLVTLQDNVMQDYSAGHIENDDAHALVAELQSAFNTAQCALYPGVSYRHLLVLSDFDNNTLETVPPHDISGKPFEEYLPSGQGSEQVRSLMERARRILALSVVNNRRIARGKVPATDIWLWGQGRAVALPTIPERFGLSGSVISAVDLVRGLGVLAGLEVRRVEGATGYLGTNYAGKVLAACDALDTQDFVFLHVEAPDETSHEGSLQKKIQAIEEFDRQVVGEFLHLNKEREDLRIMVTPDHATPLSLRTHHEMPVPCVICGAGVESGGFESYCESAAAGTPCLDGPGIFDGFIKGDFPESGR